MPLRVFLDEDLPRKAEALLASMGLDVAYVPAAGLKGLRNGDLLSRATREKRILVTRDKGFLRKGRYPAGSHCGIVVVRLRFQNTQNLLGALEDFFSLPHAEPLGWKVATLREDGHEFVG